jgi:transposase
MPDARTAIAIPFSPSNRDRLVALKKAKKKLITQKEAAEELGITERQVRRLLKKLKKGGDKAVLHALRGGPSNRRMQEAQQRAVEILSQEGVPGITPPTEEEERARRRNGAVQNRPVQPICPQKIGPPLLHQCHDLARKLLFLYTCP